MDLFIIVADADGSSEQGTWVLGGSEEDVLLEALRGENKKMEYLIENEVDHWHRLYEVEYSRDDDRNLDEMFDFYMGACADVTSFLRNAERLTELQKLMLEADRQA